MVDNLSKPQDALRFTGSTPRFTYRCGDTYGSSTNKVIMDRSINKADSMLLSNRTTDDFQVNRPSVNKVDIISSREIYGDSIYFHPMTPGYEGFIPKLSKKLGQRYTVDANEGLTDLQLKNQQNHLAFNQITQIGLLQDGRYIPSQKDNKLTSSQFTMPLIEVRPDEAGVSRYLTVHEPALLPRNHDITPYFIDNSNDPERYIKQGFSGHIPFGYAKYGMTNSPMTNSTVCDFTSNYRRRLSTEWAPTGVVRQQPPLLIQPTEIYHKHIGMLPNYMGHIPGEQFRCGKTKGNDTRDAKKWLRGDYSF